MRDYLRSECIVFRKTKEAFGGLSNMAADYSLDINGVRILSSEALYQACRFPHLAEVQKNIIKQKSPMTAKMVGKPFRKDSRPDWDMVRVRVMRWCLRVKLSQNWIKFRNLLLSTGDQPIVEESRKDDYWGAKAIGNDRLVGMNVLGRLLMELREKLREPDAESLKIVYPPDIPNFLLYGKGIGVIEGRLSRPIEQIIDTAPPKKQIEPEIALPLFDIETPIGGNELNSANTYPKRLIEVDLPIKRISAHARREKSIRHGHISTLHIWWARRPQAACRAVLCAALWPDPVDTNCPHKFRITAANVIMGFAKKAANDKGLMDHCSPENWSKWVALSKSEDWFNPEVQSQLYLLRSLLLDFIADFADWDNSNNLEYLNVCDVLTKSAHESLGGVLDSRPLVMDPFAGGGSIPLEAMRVGADVFASDLNPVPILLNKVVLEYIPKYGQKLSEEVKKWGSWIKDKTEKELAEFYPKDPDGSNPIAHIWARTITCEGPSCGATIPLMRSLWLSKKGNRSVALQIVPDKEKKQVNFQLIELQGKIWSLQGNTGIKISSPSFNGTVKRGSATCPCCGYTTPAENTRKQFIKRNGGADDARLIAVVLQKPGLSGTFFRLGSDSDQKCLAAAVKRRAELEDKNTSNLSLLPNEPLPYLRSIFNVNLLGINEWGMLFNSRQALALITLVKNTKQAVALAGYDNDSRLSTAVETCLAFAIDRCADYWSSLAVWAGEFVAHTFGRQALGIIWDYAEVNGFAGGSGNYEGAVDWICRVIEKTGNEFKTTATVEQASACNHPLPDDSTNVFFTDPPYYDAVPYADLSDFFYVWLKRSVGHLYPKMFQEKCTPKDGEIVQLSERNQIYAHKTREYFETLMKEAMTEGRRVLGPSGIGIVVFAHKSTTGWETQLQAMIDAGWVVTASWPIDTERPGRLRANNAAALASSVHLVCRPREKPDGSLRTGDIGDWRDVLQELPQRIHEWMPRLASEGVVGADAIFACLGPALEVFSQYSHVEKASGEQVMLREYLEQVWAVVAKEALDMIFAGAETTGFEPDARLTAMWLWTLSTGTDNGEQTNDEDTTEETDDDEDGGKTKKAVGGFALEYDAARKIAQGLGAHLEKLGSLVELKGETARLLPVSERAVFLFGKDAGQTPEKKKKKDTSPQLDLFKVLGIDDTTEQEWDVKSAAKIGESVLDRLHQSMILFAAGRGEALKRFLVEDGVGRDQRFWRLAQAFSALYPSATDEKRWVDGVLARKKGLGF